MHTPQNAPQSAPVKLTDRQEAICTFISKNSTLSKKEIAGALGISYGILKRELSAMSKRIHHVGPSKGGHWEVIEE